MEALIKRSNVLVSGDHNDWEWDALVGLMEASPFDEAFVSANMKVWFSSSAVCVGVVGG